MSDLKCVYINIMPDHDIFTISTLTLLSLCNYRLLDLVVKGSSCQRTERIALHASLTVAQATWRSVRGLHVRDYDYGVSYLAAVGVWPKDQPRSIGQTESLIRSTD